MEAKKTQGLKLSTTGKVVVALSLAYMGVAPALAANIVAVGDTQVTHKGKVDIVNIAAPNDQGLSHNQYDKYNVGEHGAILNNSLTAGKSYLAGNIDANKQLKDHAASVILNEVVSKNPSLILGKQEIFGMAADYVLANPNGITYNGANSRIINAPRVSLVVGKPSVENGRLNSFEVGAGKTNAALTINGNVEGNKTSVLDLVAPRVIVNAKANVKATDNVNVVSGANKVSYEDSQVIEKLKRDQKAPVLDGSIFGSMNAGSIRIHGSDGSENISHANLHADKALTVDVDGNLHVTSSRLTAHDIALNASNTVLDGQVRTTTSRPGGMTRVTEGNRVQARYTKRATTSHFDATSIKADNLLAFNNTNNLDIKGAKVNAGSLSIAAKNVAANGVSMKNTSMDTFDRTKGLWFNRGTNAHRNDVLNQAEINVREDMVVNTKGNTNLNAAVVKVGHDLKLEAGNNINLNGAKTIEAVNQNVNFKNETAKLKTGSSERHTNNEVYHATDIQAGGNVVVKSNQLNAAGAHVKAGGNLLTDVNKVNLSTETTRDVANINDRMKFWGGLGGGREGVNTLNEETLHGAALVAGGKVFLNTTNGAQIHGSAVKGKEGAFIDAGNGKANITNAVATHHTTSNERIGTIFNITKSRNSNDSTIQTAMGSTLRSDANLRVASKNDINIIGSQIQAAKDLTIESVGKRGNINIAAAQTHSTSNSSSFSIGAKKPTITGSGKDQSVSVGIGLTIKRESEQSNKLTHAGSNVSAGQNVTVKTANNVTIHGSNVAAKGDVNVNAKNITTSAAHDTSDTNSSKRVTDLGITVTASANNGNPKLNINAGITSQKNTNHTVANTAQVSGVSGKNVNLVAENNISHEGTKIQAANDINQKAKNISHVAAQNTSNSKTTESKGGISVDVGLGAGGVSTTLTAFGSGGKGTEGKTTVQGGKVQSGGNVNIVAENKVTDVGTDYNSKGNINIAAKDYVNQAAQESSHHTSNKGGADVSVGVGVSAGGVNVDVGGNINYNHEKGNATQAVKGSLNGKNVTVNAGNTATIAADVKATENVTLNATKGVTLVESKNTQNSVSGGFNLGGNVGVTVTPAGVPVVSSVGVKAGVNYGKANVVEGSGSNVSGKNVNIDAGKQLTLQGTNVTAAKAVNIKADKVDSHASNTKRDVTGVDVGVNAHVGFSNTGVADSGGAGANFDVKREKENSNPANTIKGNTVSIATNFKGSGVNLVGSNVEANKFYVTNANKQGSLVSTTKLDSSYSNVSVGAGVELEGKLVTEKWTEKRVAWCGREYEVPHVKETPKITGGGGGGHLEIVKKTPPPTGGEIPKISVPPQDPPKPTPPKPIEPPVVIPPKPAEPPVPTTPKPPVVPSVPDTKPVENNTGTGDAAI